MIIGLIGARGSGKDYAANVIINNFDNWSRLAFADPIKLQLQQIFQCDRQAIERLKRADQIVINQWYCDDDFQSEVLRTNATGRDVVRNIGMLMRQYDDQQFNRYVQEQIVNNPQINYVITDVRFDNEYQLLKQLGGVMIEINRYGYEYDGHVTESGKLRGDIVINNTDDGQFDQLIIETVCSMIGNK